MVIRYARTVVGSTPRVAVVSPFPAKDAIKGALIARWESRRKCWTIPFTRRALRHLVAAIDKVHPGTQHVYDPTVEPIVGKAIEIAEVVPSRFEGAVLKQRDVQVLGSSMIGQLEGCLLGWDMGAGKTKAVFDAFLQHAMRFALVGCPTSVVPVWAKQYPMHVPEEDQRTIRFLALENGTVDRRAKLLRDAYEGSLHDPTARVFAVINFEAMWREAFLKVAESIPWDVVVADECQRISGHTTKICKAMSRRIGPASKRRVGLSGTPLSNGPEDAFGQMMFIEPALFGESVTRFRSDYCVMGGFEGHQILDYKNMEQYKRLVGSITSRVKLSDIVELPEATDEEVHVHLCPEARRVYDELRENFIALHSEGVITASNALAKLLRLQQVTSGFAVVTDDEDEQRAMQVDTGKAEALRDLFASAPKDEPMVVFCRFTRDIAEVHRIALEEGRPSFELSGAANQQKAWEAESDLGRGPVFAVQIQSGGVGIDLTRARYCIYYSLGFSLTDYVQSRARVHRPGQKRPVFYYHLIVPGTVDRVVYNALRDKRKVVDAVLEDLTSAGVAS